LFLEREMFDVGPNQDEGGQNSMKYTVFLYLSNKTNWGMPLCMMPKTKLRPGNIDLSIRLNEIIRRFTS
jgi:hypothetical protein